MLQGVDVVDVGDEITTRLWNERGRKESTPINSISFHVNKEKAKTGSNEINLAFSD